MVQPMNALALINALLALDAQLRAVENAINVAMADLPTNPEFHTLASIDASLQVVKVTVKDWLDRTRVTWP